MSAWISCPLDVWVDILLNYMVLALDQKVRFDKRSSSSNLSLSLWRCVLLKRSQGRTSMNVSKILDHSKEDINSTTDCIGRGGLFNCNSSQFIVYISGIYCCIIADDRSVVCAQKVIQVEKYSTKSLYSLRISSDTFSSCSDLSVEVCLYITARVQQQMTSHLMMSCWMKEKKTTWDRSDLQFYLKLIINLWMNWHPRNLHTHS